MPNNSQNQLVVRNKAEAAKLERRKVKKMVKAMVDARIEVKFFDTFTTAYTYLSYVGLLKTLSNISEGTTISTRNGDQIRPARLELQWSAYFVPGSTVASATSNIVRVVLLRWHQNDADWVPSMGDIFAYTGSNYTEAINSPFNYNSTMAMQKLFTVLYDKRVSIGLSPGGAHGEVSIPLKGTSTFDTGYNTGTNNLWLCALSDDGTGLNAYPMFGYYARLLFRDA
jgi:hypothetical protein